MVDGLTARVLARVGGERTLTDLRHIGEALHKVSVDERLGIVGLLAWLRAQVADEQVEVASERTRRLDSDAAAVQLVTIHGSKGLQYPIVYAPTLWNRYTGNDPDVPLFHDADGHRARDVGGASPWRGEHVARHRREDAGESLRLLYVALTRAQSQVVAWYAPAALNTAGLAAAPAALRSAARHVLGARRAGRRHRRPGPGDPRPLAGGRRAGARASRQPAAGPDAHRAVRPRPRGPAVHPRGRHRVASHLLLVPVRGGLHPARLRPLAVRARGGPRARGRRRPRAARPRALRRPARPRARARCPRRWPTLPVGATFGSLVHAVLEHADPGAADFRADVLRPHRRAAGLVARRPRRRGARRRAASPSAPARSDRSRPRPRCSTSRPRDRLTELDFELPLAGGDDARTPTGHRPARRPRAAAATPPARGRPGPWLRRRARGRPRRWPSSSSRGYLTGSIDVVLRVEVQGRTRYVTADYKTNWLGDLAAPLTAARLPPGGARRGDGALRLPAPGAALRRGPAPLPALAAARLRPCRAPRAACSTSTCAACAGPDTPRVAGAPCGVFAWRPPVALVEDLSDLLDGVGRE